MLRGHSLYHQVNEQRSAAQYHHLETEMLMLVLYARKHLFLRQHHCKNLLRLRISEKRTVYMYMNNDGVIWPVFHIRCFVIFSKVFTAGYLAGSAYLICRQEHLFWMIALNYFNHYQLTLKTTVGHRPMHFEFNCYYDIDEIKNEPHLY